MTASSLMRHHLGLFACLTISSSSSSRTTCLAILCFVLFSFVFYPMIELFCLHTLLHITTIIIALRYSTLPACLPACLPVLVRLQTPVGTIRVRRSEYAPRPIRSHLATRHQPLQQVSFYLANPQSYGGCGCLLVVISLIRTTLTTFNLMFVNNNNNKKKKNKWRHILPLAE